MFQSVTAEWQKKSLYGSVLSQSTCAHLHLCVSDDKLLFAPTPGRDKWQDPSAHGRGASRCDCCDPAVEPGGERWRCHVQWLHTAAPGCGQTGRHRRQPSVSVGCRPDDQEHGGWDATRPRWWQWWCKSRPLRGTSDWLCRSLKAFFFK